MSPFAADASARPTVLGPAGAVAPGASRRMSQYGGRVVDRGDVPDPAHRPAGVLLRSHPAVRTLMLTSGELTTWLFDERTSSVREVRGAAAVVWALLEEPITFDTLVAELTRAFELDPVEADRSATAAVGALRAEALIDEELIDEELIDEIATDGPDGADLAGDASTRDGAGEPSSVTGPDRLVVLSRAPDP